MVVIRKNISREKGEVRLIDEIRYFFYITNDRRQSASRIVFGCNDRCHQENLIAQLAAVRALHAPVDNLTSNWAYMVMTSFGLDTKGLGSIADSCPRPLARRAPTATRSNSANGVQNIRQRDDSHSLPDHS